MQARLADYKQRVIETWKTNGKFTIHPFKSLHSKHLLPLSIGDYVSRFSLELVLMGITIIAVWSNFALITHASVLTSTDQSVIFSFLKSKPDLNRQLLASSDTTTITSRVDQQVATPSAFGVVLAASTSAGNKTKALTSSTIQADVIFKTNPSDTLGLPRDGITHYQVQPGDTIVTIAASFGFSPQTLMIENKITNDSQLKIGRDLTILQTTGISHTITANDTMESILKKYKISEEDFLDANNIESFDDLDIGANVVIPMDVSMPNIPKPASKFIKDDSNQIALKQASAPADLDSGPVDFVWPTTARTITQKFSSRHTGIDISDSRMEPVYAACSGFVEISGYQANGYGNTIVINCGNGFKTRYGHLSELYVQAGDYVTQSQLIAKQGRTGRVRGATGIHLHFEIIKNRVHVNPSSYVRP